MLWVHQISYANKANAGAHAVQQLLPGAWQFLTMDPMALLLVMGHAFVNRSWIYCL